MLGSGTAEDPYQVATAEDLNDVRNNLGAYYEQIADIDLSGYTNWVPIGDEDTPFTGQYDGGNFNIFNMTINTSADFTGLFGYVNTDTTTSISNVNMVDIDIKTSGDMVGALVGQLAGGNITNCHSSGLIEATITNSIYDIGGLIGYIFYFGDEENQTITIANCSSSVSIHGDFSTAENYRYLNYCGGLIGAAEGAWVNIYITDCFSTGDIKQIAPLVPNSKKFGFFACGGFIGGAEEDSNHICKISKCYSTGDISTGWSCGGFVGYLVFGEVINCYSLGNVLAPEGFETYDRYNDCGGFCGEHLSISRRGLITNCYTTGDVTGISWDDEGTFAAFTPWGLITDPPLINCYYNSDLSSRTDNIAIPKTTLEMKTQATFSGWDFQTVWAIDSGYPYLQWSKTVYPLQTGKDYVLVTPFPGGTMEFGGKEYKFIKYLERFDKEQHQVAGVERAYEYGGPLVKYGEQTYGFLASGITDPAAEGGFGTYLPDTKRTVLSLADRENFVNFYYIYPALPQVEKPVWVKKVITWKDVAGAAAYEVKLFLDTEEQCIDTQLVGPGVQRFDFTYFIESFMPAGNYLCTVQALATEVTRKAIVWVDTEGATSYTVNLYNSDGEIVYTDSVAPGVQTYDFTAIIPTLPTGTNYYGVAIPVIPA